MDANPLRFVRAAWAILLLATMVPLFSAFCPAQKPPADPSQPREMIVTAAGFLVLDTPKGWVQTDGPGLAFFLPKGVDVRVAEVWMYVSATPFGPSQDDKDFHSAVQSDIAGFRQHFSKGVVRAEAPLELPRMKRNAEVFVFESGEVNNAFEQTAYIEDLGRMWTLTLSAKSRAALARSIPDFHAFVQSYGGSIQMGSPPTK
jgi:hypothetical protein